MSKTINLGRVTAYADAVAAGYTGTREQFANDLANAANYAAEAGDAAETATEAATTASTAAETATDKAEEASADAEQAHADAQAILGAKETAVAAAATASSKAGEAANSAQQAAASETAAAGSATTASNAATSATASKQAAATSETNAANSASQAAQTLTNVNQAGATQVATIQAKGTEVLNSIPADYTELSNDVDALKSDLNELYDVTTFTDMYGANASVAGTDNALISGSWDSVDKEVTVSMSASASSADTYYVMLAPKFISGHTYKIAIKYTFETEQSYVSVRNVFALNNMNNRDNLLNGVLRDNNFEEVLTLNATSDGWLALCKRVSANLQQTWAFKVAVYDVTDIDVSSVSDSIWLSFEDVIVLDATGIIPQVQLKAEYTYLLTSNVKGETWTALGDSLTAQGSGSQYLDYVKSKLGLANYYNCGIGGTTISGAINTNAMYQNTRIEALNLGSDCITILGGTNDAWQEYYKDNPSANMTGWGDCVRTNHDVTTFCGAYNVMLSKIFYKFCKVIGYYEDVDYSGITQVATAIDNFRVILMTPPQAFHVEGDSMSATLQLKGLTAAHSYVKQIAELWGLPCVDTWEMGMNDMNRSLFFANYLTDATHFNAFGHERLASLLINKTIQVSRYK